jgi:hypothetical protein
MQLITHALGTVVSADFGGGGGGGGGGLFGAGGRGRFEQCLPPRF